MDAEKEEMRLTIFEKVDQLCDQWERNAPPIPPDARHLLKQLAKQIVMDAAEVCDKRASREDGLTAICREAAKCAAAVRHFSLCREHEHVCYRCDGTGEMSGKPCDSCGGRGIKEQW